MNQNDIDRDLRKLKNYKLQGDISTVLFIVIGGIVGLFFLAAAPWLIIFLLPFIPWIIKDNNKTRRRIEYYEGLKRRDYYEGKNSTRSPYC